MLTSKNEYDNVIEVDFKNRFRGGSMKNDDLVGLYQYLGQNSKRFEEIGNTKFAYFYNKNKNLIEQEVKQLDAARKTDPAWVEYNKKRETLAKEHADKDEKGEAIIEKSPFGSKYKITDIKAFEEKFKVLSEENKEIIAKQDALNKEFEGLLEEESKIVLHKIKQDNLPDCLSAKDLNTLKDLIIE